MMDGYLAQLDAMGAVIALTADHGMNAKHGADGAPAVIYLQDQLDEWLGAGAARVILPITDPYVVHHGALGSFATIYLPEGADVADRLRALDGVDYVEPKPRPAPISNCRKTAWATWSWSPPRASCSAPPSPSMTSRAWKCRCAPMAVFPNRPCR